MKKRLLQLALCFCLALALLAVSQPTAAAWDGTADTDWAGSGTRTAPYLITSEAELAGLAQNVNNGEPYGGKHFLLTADLDLGGVNTNGVWSGQKWTPISASYGNPFYGVFDGAGHRISNLYIDRTEYYSGLFGRVEGGILKNITVASGNVTGKQYTGGVAGCVINSPVTNCANSAAVNGTEGVGGVVGVAKSATTVTNCSNTGAVNCTGDSTGGVAGGLYDSTVANSANTGSVTGKGYIGGVAGYISNSTVVNSYNTGSVTGTGTGDNIGGVAGHIGSSTVKNCYWLIGTAASAVANATGTVIDCASFTAEQGKGTAKTFRYTIDTITKTGALCDALNDGAAAYNSTDPAPVIEADTWVASAGENNGYPRFGVITPQPYDPPATLDHFTVLTETEGEGSIAPTYAWLRKGKSQSFQFTPANGYEVANVLLDGVSLGALTAYAVADIEADHTLTVVFKKSGSAPDDPAKPDDPPIQNQYRDVNQNDWFYGDVLFVTENGLMGGTAPGIFDPNGNITRAMAAAVLFRNEKTAASSVSAYTDVTEGKYYTEAVVWATEKGLVKGYPDNSFKPNQNISREELAAIFYRYAAYKNMDVTLRSDLSSFKDAAQVASWAKESVQWAVAAKLISGKPGSLLAPRDSATRAEFAALLQRLLQ